MSKLPATETLDFHYLLSLLPALEGIDEYAWLPELFSIIGHERLIKLCKFAGGEVIKIPTLDELANNIEALQIYYNVYIKKVQFVESIPKKYLKQVASIKEYSDAQLDKKCD